MEIIEHHVLMEVTKELTLKAIDKDLLPINRNDINKSTKTIAEFFSKLSDALSEPIN